MQDLRISVCHSQDVAVPDDILVDALDHAVGSKALGRDRHSAVLSAGNGKLRVLEFQMFHGNEGLKLAALLSFSGLFVGGFVFHGDKDLLAAALDQLGKILREKVHSGKRSHGSGNGLLIEHFEIQILKAYFYLHSGFFQALVGDPEAHGIALFADASCHRLIEDTGQLSLNCQ